MCSREQGKIPSDMQIKDLTDNTVTNTAGMSVVFKAA